MKELVAALIRKQKDLCLSESDFARKLGISRPMWYQIKRGKRQPQLEILKKISNVFPDLQILVFSIMTEKVDLK